MRGAPVGPPDQEIGILVVGYCLRDVEEQDCEGDHAPFLSLLLRYQDRHRSAATRSLFVVELSAQPPIVIPETGVFPDPCL